MIRRLVSIALAALALGAAAPAVAQSVHTPPPGSPERSAILDAVRAPLIEHVGGRVEFVVETLRVGGGWAYLEAQPQRPGGGSIPADDYMDGNTTYAVLRQQGGRWIVDNWTYGANDVWWVYYCDQPARIVVSHAC